ncbi:hypothetical protein G7054_g12970 [Neopestalotiopsis clavispora]|nr:hypothetical protein G7054_g12970 [Neopestalotiopsis clavispora]
MESFFSQVKRAMLEHCHNLEFWKDGIRNQRNNGARGDLASFIDERYSAGPPSQPRCDLVSGDDGFGNND